MNATVGATLFSFTDEWRRGVLDLTALLERVADNGLGPDVELVGYQSFRGLPTPSPDEVDQFRDDVRRLRLNPTAFGVYIDRARRPEDWLSTDESVGEVASQLRIAHRLGFTSARGVLGISTDVLTALLPVLDELDMVLTLEVQGPHTPETPHVATLITWLQANDGAPVGLTLDSSVAMTDLPASYRRTLRRLGMGPETEEALDVMWRAEGPPFQRLTAFLQAVQLDPGSDTLSQQLTTAFIRFGHGRLDEWTFALPWVRHAHAKFWDWDHPQTHVLAPHQQFVEMLAGYGYNGSISSEFGGIAWLDREDVDVFELTLRHITFLRSVVAGAVTVS